MITNYEKEPIGVGLNAENEIIQNSNFKLTDIVGEWHTCVTEDGSQSDEIIVFQSDGTGMFATNNFGCYDSNCITWRIENDILSIQRNDSDTKTFPVIIEKDVIVPCMSGNEYHFTAIRGIYNLDFYRNIEYKTIQEHEYEAEKAIVLVLNESQAVQQKYQLEPLNWREEGRVAGKEEAARKMFVKGFSFEDIQDITGFNTEILEKIRLSISK
jgi:hypothetical protein